MILSTDVAESSVTFGDPIVYVVDSGLAYKPVYDPENYCVKKGNVVAQANIKQGVVELEEVVKVLLSWIFRKSINMNLPHADPVYFVMILLKTF